MNDGIGVNHTMPAGLSPAQSFEAAVHAVQTRIELVLLAALTYVSVKGKWCDLYRAIDRDGNLVDSLPSREAG
jgi:hypothetical protein